MRVVAFNPAVHLPALTIQPAQEGELLPREHADTLAAWGQCYAAEGEGGRVYAVAGVVECGDGRGMAWALVDRHAGAHFVKIHRAVTRFLEISTLRRIEATVDCNFEAGHRWLRMLGFRMEAPRMVAYTPDGRDCALYARIR